MDGLSLYTLKDIYLELNRRYDNVLLVCDGVDPGDPGPSTTLLYYDRFAGIGLAEYAKKHLLDGDNVKGVITDEELEDDDGRGT